MRDLIPERIVVRGRDKGDVVRVAPHFVKPVRPLRGVQVQLQRPPREGPPLFDMSDEEELEWERSYPPVRLKRFGALLVRRFKLTSKAIRVSGKRGGTMHIHLWEGPGTKSDYRKMRAVMKFIEKHAKEI